MLDQHVVGAVAVEVADAEDVAVVRKRVEAEPLAFAVGVDDPAAGEAVGADQHVVDAVAVEVADARDELARREVAEEDVRAVGGQIRPDHALVVAEQQIVDAVAVEVADADDGDIAPEAAEVFPAGDFALFDRPRADEIVALALEHDVAAVFPRQPRAADEAPARRGLQHADVDPFGGLVGLHQPRAAGTVLVQHHDVAAAVAVQIGIDPGERLRRFRRFRRGGGFGGGGRFPGAGTAAGGRVEEGLMEKMAGLHTKTPLIDVDPFSAFPTRAGTARG